MTVAPVSYRCWDHPDLVAGYDPSDMFKGSDGATYMRDKSGHGRHAKQSGTAPTMVPSILPAKRMDGGKGAYQVYGAGNNWWDVAIDAAQNGPTMTAIAFYKCTANDANNHWPMYMNGSWAIGTVAPSLANVRRIYIWGLTPATFDMYGSNGEVPAAFGTEMLAATWGDGYVRLYLNGNLVYVMPTTGTPTVGVANLNLAGAAGGNAFGGVLDNTLIFKRVLSATEIRKIWDSAMALPRVWGDVKTGVKGTPMNLCRANDQTDDPYLPGWWANDLYGLPGETSHIVEDGYDVILTDAAARVFNMPVFTVGASCTTPTFFDQCTEPQSEYDARNYDYMDFDFWFSTGALVGGGFIIYYFQYDFSTAYKNWGPATLPNANTWTTIRVPMWRMNKINDSTAQLSIKRFGVRTQIAAGPALKIKLRNIRFGKFGWNVIDFDRPEDLNRFTTTRVTISNGTGLWNRLISNGKLYYSAITGGAEGANYWGPCDQLPVNITGDFVVEAKIRAKRTSGSFGYLLLQLNGSIAGTQSSAIGLMQPGASAYYIISLDSTAAQLRITDSLGGDITAILRMIRRNGVIICEADYGGSTINLGTFANTNAITSLAFLTNWYANVNNGQEYWVDYLRWREF